MTLLVIEFWVFCQVIWDYIFDFYLFQNKIETVFVLPNMKTIYAHCEKFRKRQKVKNILKITCQDTTKNATKFYLLEVKKNHRSFYYLGLTSIELLMVVITR